MTLFPTTPLRKSVGEPVCDWAGGAGAFSAGGGGVESMMDAWFKEMIVCLCCSEARWTAPELVKAKSAYIYAITIWFLQSSIMPRTKLNDSEEKSSQKRTAVTFR